MYAIRSYYGQKHGEFISYYTNGQIWSKGSYFNDKETGKFYSYYRNGQLEEEKEYTNGTRSGNTIQYYENGNIKIEYLNHNNGNKTRITSYNVCYTKLLR